MRRSGWIIAAVSLVLTQGASAGAGSLEVLVESGRVTVNAHEAPLGEIVKALSERARVHVVLDALRSAQPVTVHLETGGIHEAIVRLMREVGGGNYAIFSSDSQGKVETFAFQEGAAPPAPQATPMAPPASEGPRAYAVEDGSATYAPPARNPYERPAAPSAPYPSMVSRSPGSAAAAPPAPGADDVDGPASLNPRDELAAVEYQEHLETTRRGLEKGAKKIEDEY